MKKKTIKDIQLLANKYNGECLSQIINGVHKKVIWKCEFGHIWESKPNNIKQGHWCPCCANTKRRERNKKYNINDMRELAKDNNGRCLNNRYISPSIKLTWKCSKGHIWKATFGNIKYHKQWCPKCSYQRNGIKNIKNTIKDMNNLAKIKKGKCLSKKYLSVKSKLRWKCSNNHIWWATPDNIKKGKWCPYCTKYTTEEKCRYILEKLTGRKFPKDRKILNNRQEIDGYNKSLHVGFEYQGEQHYSPKFGQKAFRETQIMDKKKKRRIKKLKNLNKIKEIIFIPYWRAKSDEELKYFIDSCQKNPSPCGRE